jgi:small Trp-rich protein
MVGVVIGVVLLLLWLLDIGPIGAWPWWLIALPFGGAMLWWWWADTSGWTKRRHSCRVTRVAGGAALPLVGRQRRQCAAAALTAPTLLKRRPFFWSDPAC